MSRSQNKDLATPDHYQSVLTRYVCGCACVLAARHVAGTSQNISNIEHVLSWNTLTVQIEVTIITTITVNIWTLISAPRIGGVYYPIRK